MGYITLADRAQLLVHQAFTVVGYIRETDQAQALVHQISAFVGYIRVAVMVHLVSKFDQGKGTRT